MDNSEAGKTVMVIEDDASMAAVLRTLLELEGYRVEIGPGKHGIESILQAIRDTRPDLLLIDVHLQQTNGYEVVKRLREDETIAGTRVLMSSGMDVEERCMKAGADGFLLKPFMPDELIKKLAGVQ
jgi:DNA-binding response OmpR family regulator